MRHLPCRQSVSRFDQIGERLTHAVDFLIVLMALAGQHQHIIGTGSGNQLGNRLATAMNELH